MAGLSDFLFEGKPPPQITTIQANNQQLPEFMQAYLQGLLGRGNSIVGQETFTPNPFAKVEGFTPDQTSAFGKVRDLQGASNPQFNQANTSLTGSTEEFPSAAQRYLSPYTAAVTDNIARLGQENLAEKLLPAVNQTFTSSGQFGSDRNADFTARALRDTNREILGQQAQVMESGYKTAGDLFNADQSRKIDAAKGLTDLGTSQFDTRLREAAALEGVGQSQQDLNQRSLDTSARNFQEQQNFGKNQLRFMSEIIRGLPAPVSSTQAQVAEQGASTSPLQQIAGAGLGIASLLGRSKGGRVKSQYVAKTRLQPVRGGLAAMRG